MSSSSSNNFFAIPRSNPQMEEEIFTKEDLDKCVKKLQKILLSRISEHQIQLKEMLSFLRLYMDEDHASAQEIHTEEDYPFPYEIFDSDIFGNNVKRILDQSYDAHYDKFGKKIEHDIYIALVTYFYPVEGDDNSSIHEENPQGMGGGGKTEELDKALETTKLWHLFVLKKYMAYKEASNKGSKKKKTRKKKTRKKKTIRNRKTIRVRNTT